MRGASLITEGPWPGEGRVLPPSRKRVRTRSQPVRSWRSMARRPELARAHLVAAAAVVSRPAPCHHHHPPPGSRSAAEVAVPLAADRPELPVWGGGRGSPSTGELVLLSYPSCAPHLAPTANSGAAERGPRQVEEGKRAQARGRAGGGEGGACPPLL